MTKLSEVLFPDSYPKIDLHGYDRDTGRVATLDFINDSYIMGHEIIVIVHGGGTGVLKETVHKTLKNNPLVIEYKTGYFNNGCTIVNIKHKDKNY